MGKTKTKSFILELKLNTQPHHEHILNKKFNIARLMYNNVLSYALKRYYLMLESKSYREALSCYRNAKTKEDKKSYEVLLNSIRVSFDLTEYSLHSFIKKQQNMYKKNIDSATSQKIASAVWTALESLIFGKGEKAHFKKFGELNSLEGKSNAQGIRFVDDSLVWGKFTVPVIIRGNDLFAKECLSSHRIKFCRIFKKVIKGKDIFYLQLVLEGTPPAKKNNKTGELKHNLTKNQNKRVGIDIGTSSIAVCSEHKVLLKELGTSSIKTTEKELLKAQRKLDRSKRATNPNNFNPDGTIKRGIKLTWGYSKNYKRTLLKVKELHRLKSVKLKQSHNILANEIIALGNIIFVENMNFKALQKRAKETKVSEKTGKYIKKKRFGKSIGNYAPAMLILIINKKLQYQNLEINKVNTQKFKASQYNHVEDNYVKVSLSTRNKQIEESLIQRDCYSAFLLMNSSDNLEECDKSLCEITYKNFLEKHNKCIKDVKNSNVKLLSSFGIKRTI